MNSGLFGFWLRFGSVTGFFKPAPSPKPRQKPKILAAHRYIFSVNAPKISGGSFRFRPRCLHLRGVLELSGSIRINFFCHAEAKSNRPGE
jgi:hypothetical protein